MGVPVPEERLLLPRFGPALKVTSGLPKRPCGAERVPAVRL